MVEGEWVASDLGSLSPEGRYVFEKLMPEWSVYFTGKNMGYASDGNDLGSKGIVPDIDRKAKKIKRAVWDGEILTGEQPREILFDLIGHCFLMAAELDKENGVSIE